MGKAKKLKNVKKVKNIKKFGKIDKKLYTILVFLIKFNILAIPLYLILLTGYQSSFLLESTTDLAFGLIQATGLEAEKNGMIIISIETGKFGAPIDWDCTGWKSMLALFALIFATDFRLKKKLLGLLLIPIVYAINILRIWFMFFFVKNYGILYYDFVHKTIWSWGLIFTILVLWVVWMKWFPDLKKGRKT